ncbi:MAG: bifunctional phosphopantothenoylcysteine decarboxylase/phosphopantothenate--cysteine ligase CoaBC [Acidimicrobiia bacterium]|nr:bifunctional phosphopantothenoylcysteine decarboxylase/phosphopantothenate--cysteine ligase CoaBC [Acidimicrobiia bacterium]
MTSRIVLGVTGGVAAYKAAYLARRLVEDGHEVRSIITDSSQRFLGPQTLAAITGHHPVTSLFAAGSVSPHTELARWADAVVVAPATASLMGRLAAGISDDVLTATLLACTKPVVLAPAMHTEMWEHAATQRNAAQLAADGYQMVGPVAGALAGGDTGMGRMSEPNEIAEALYAAMAPADFAGRRVIVSAGGTREPIDAVRFIGNRSSGKMGHAIAVEAARRGASVTLVTSSSLPAHPSVEVLFVDTAEEMAEAVWHHAVGADVAILAAAVADFRPRGVTAAKIRRADGLPELELEATPDILAGVAAMPDRPFLVGFAAEAGSIDGAVVKAATKGVDLLVANDISASGSEFGSDNDEVTLVWPDGSTDPWELLPKTQVAARLLDRIRDAKA